VIIPLDLTQLFCPGFTLATGPPSSFTTDGVGCCNLTSFAPCLTGPVDYRFASRHKGPRFKSPGGYLCETGILLLAMSRYRHNILKHMLNITKTIGSRINLLGKIGLRPWKSIHCNTVVSSISAILLTQLSHTFLSSPYTVVPRKSFTSLTQLSPKYFLTSLIQSS
jgi:hypothetical protein